MYNTILVPLDRSKRAEVILQHVESLALKYKAKVVFMKVIDIPPLKIGYSRKALEQYRKDLEVQEKRDGEYLADMQRDFMEKGIRKNLNFGHTLGHAFESFFLRTNHPVTHGQAIAAGMICEGWLSQKAYELEAEQFVEIVRMFDINFERLPISEDNIPELLELMRQDKKARGGKLNYSLLRKIGKAIHNIEVDIPLVIESLKYYINE